METKSKGMDAEALLWISRMDECREASGDFEGIWKPAPGFVWHAKHL